MTPLRAGTKLVEGLQSITVHRSHDHLTCFQSSRPKSNLPPPPCRSRSKPVSMMRRRAISVTGMAVIANLLLWILGTSQEMSWGTHSERIYGYISHEDHK